jgi:acetoacetate decarboxylase
MNHLIGMLGSYKSSAGAGPPVTSGLRLWLDGADPLGTGAPPANGTSITSWKDKSGNSAHATSSGTCVYQSSSTSIALTSGSYSNTTISAGTFDIAIFIFAVYRGKGAGSFNPLISRSKASNNLGNPDMYNNNRIYMTGVGSFGSLTSSYNLDNSSISTRSIFGYSMNRSANNISEWINGTSNTITGTYTLPANMDSGNSFNGIYIGTRGDGVTGPFTGNFSEILIYNTALTTTQRQDIEGYLAQKWGLQTWLPSSHPYYYNSGSVPVISGLRLWLDGSDPLATGTAPANGTSITSWKDKSGNSAHATSSGTCVYQSFSKSIGLTSGSYSNTTISAGTFDSAIFIFAVYKIKGTGTNAGYNPLITRSRATYNIGNPDMFNNARYYMTGLTTWAGVSSSYHLDNSTSTQNIFAYSMNQPTNNISEWTNGTSNTITGTYTLPPNMDSINSFNGIYIGTRGDNFTGPSTGNFSEILIYNTPLTNTQRQDIEGYLGWKWGLQKQLPLNHPYYNQPLTIIPAPTNVLMATFTAGDTTISVSWTAPAAAAVEIASYTVKFYYNTTATTIGGTVFQTITGVTATSQASSTVLANNTYYYATVASVNISGRSSYEIVSTNTIQSNPAAPTTVTMGSYTAGASTISVTWSAVTGASSYTVQFYSNSSATTTGGTLFQTFTGVLNTATSQISSTALVVNTYYYASVLTVNSVGSSSERTTSTTIQTVVAAPASASMGAYTTGATAISVLWSAVASASSYTVKFYSNTTSTTTGGTLFQTFTGVLNTATSQSSSTTLVANTYYYASVAAINSGVSSSERTTSTTILTVPVAPASATMGAYTAGATTISVSWGSVTGISSYTVRFYSSATATTSGGTLFQTITGVSTGATSQSSSTTLMGNTYYYASVAAINSGGSSSERTTSTTILTVPAAPTTVTMGSYTVGGTTISVSWSAVSGATSYTVRFYSNTLNSTTGGTIFQTITPVSSGTTSQVSSTTLVANTYYYASVTANNSGGSSLERSSSATVFTAISLPSSTSILYWFDASDTTSLATTSGTNVSTWANKGIDTSNNGRIGTPTGTVTTNVSGNNINNLNTVRFGTSARLAYIAQYESSSNTASFFVVFRGVTSFTSAGGHFFCNNNGDGSTIRGKDFFVYNLRTSAAYMAANITANNTEVRYSIDSITDTFFTESGAMLMSIQMDGTATNVANAYMNGTAYAKTKTGVAISNTTYYLTLGSSRADAKSFDMCEFILYKSILSDTNRQQIEGYLARKWGIQSKLPAGHPYK